MPRVEEKPKLLKRIPSAFDHKQLSPVRKQSQFTGMRNKLTGESFFFRYFAAPQNRNIFSWIRTTYQMNCCSHWCVTSGKLNLIENGRMTNYCAYSNKMKNKQGNTNKEKKKNRLN